jgi:hypothetical protein
LVYVKGFGGRITGDEQVLPKGLARERPGDLNWVHGLGVDSKGNIYAVDVMGKRIQKFVPRNGD